MGSVMHSGICRVRSGNTRSAPNGVWEWVGVFEQNVSITLSRTFMYIFTRRVQKVTIQRS